MNHYFKMPCWYHFKCYFQKAKNLTSTSQIKGFDMLRWDDQNKIKEKLGLTASTITTTDWKKQVLLLINFKLNMLNQIVVNAVNVVKK